MLNQKLKQYVPLLMTALLGAIAFASCTSNPQATQPTGTSTASSANPATTAAGGTCAPEIKSLDFGIISTESQDKQKPKWEPFVDAMAAKLGRQINAFYATDYAAVIEAMGANKVQLAWYGGKAYVTAAERANAEAFARTINEDGSKGYYSHLITNKENPILKEIDVNQGNGDQYVVRNAAKLTFAFNDPESTSGFLVPSYYVFAKNNVNPNQAFKQLTFAGSHEATAQAVVNKQVDVATNNSEQLSEMEKNDPQSRAKIQVIWTSPEIPSDPISYRKDLPECLKAEIRTFFYEYKDPAILGPLAWQGFEAAKDTDWNTIRELNIAKDILEVQNDKKLSDADKKQKIDELNQKLEALK